VTDNYGEPKETETYRPYGSDTTGNLRTTNYKWTGGETDESGLYYFNARYYSPEIWRFISVDPAVIMRMDVKLSIEEICNPYLYARNNPVKYTDLSGLAPGDVFATLDEVANDFGLNYNGISINQNVEYGSVIIQKEDGYTYLEPVTNGLEDYVDLPIPDGGPADALAGLHTHSAYNEQLNTEFGDGNNQHSERDKDTAKEYGKSFYVATPDVSLKEYDPNSDTVRVVNTNMPSDPNDPGRKNDIDPDNKQGEEM
jgi:RHS repeat-associated protein